LVDKNRPKTVSFKIKPLQGGKENLAEIKFPLHATEKSPTPAELNSNPVSSLNLVSCFVFSIPM